MRNPIRWLREDQNVHRAFAVIAIHELVDGALFLIVSQLHSYTVALGAWAISFISGIFLGHWAIEAHDKLEHGDKSVPTSKIVILEKPFDPTDPSNGLPPGIYTTPNEKWEQK